MMQNSKNFFVLSLLISLFVFLSGCQSIPSFNQAPKSELASSTNFQIPSDAALNQLRDPFVETGLSALQAQDYERATAAFNHALKLEPENAYLHFLNAFTYHQMLREGDSSKADMASVGYELARQFDNGAWWTEYFSGLLALESKDYALAQNLFARALLLDDDNIEIMKGLISASYYLGDIESALYVLEPALLINHDDPALIRSAALVYGAAGKDTKASAQLARYEQLDLPAYKTEYLADRLTDWHKTHQNGNTGFIKVDDSDDDSDTASDTSKAPSVSATTSDKQVVVDVVIIRSEERISDRRGINLLDGLSLTFGLTDVYSVTDLGLNSNNGVSAAANAGVEADDIAFPKVFTRSLSIPSVTYSLNIFNTIGDRNEILAKPSLIALDGEKSTFFSGAELTIGFAGTLQGGNLETKEIGVTLDVTPEFLSDDRVKLTVKAERDFFEDFAPGSFEQSVQTSKNTVTASTVMNFDQTLILSGLTEKETESIENKVPILGDIPLIKTLFNESNEVDFNKSIIFMLTPRKLTFVNEPSDKTENNDVNKEEIIRSLLNQWRTASVRYSKPENMNGLQLSQFTRVSDMNYKGWRNQENIAEAVNTAVQRLYD